MGCSNSQPVAGTRYGNEPYPKQEESAHQQGAGTGGQQVCSAEWLTKPPRSTCAVNTCTEIIARLVTCCVWRCLPISTATFKTNNFMNIISVTHESQNVLFSPIAIPFRSFCGLIIAKLPWQLKLQVNLVCQQPISLACRFLQNFFWGERGLLLF